MDDDFKKFIELNQKIGQLSNDEIVQQYLRFIHEVSNNKKLPFLLEGNVQWKSNVSEGIKRDGIWLKSKLYDPVGKHILENPVTNFLQTHMNHYEIGGAFDISVDSNDLENAKKEILGILNDITILKNSFSLLHGVSIDWVPARYIQLGVSHITPPTTKLTNEREKEYRVIRLPKYQENQISSIINDDHVTNIISFAKTINDIDEPVKTILKTSMDWHSDGNKLRSGLSRFVSFWASIELLGEFFYKHLDPKLVGKKQKGAKKKQILEILVGDLSEDSQLLQKINKCNSIVSPSIKEKVCSVLDIVCGHDKWENILFKADGGEKSLYQIRNDIAHGSISEHHFENVASLKKKLFDISKLSRKIILSTISNSKKLNITKHLS